MRVMVIIKATKDSEAGVMPPAELLEAMGRFNEELVKAGVLLAGDGLHPSSRAKRVRCTARDRRVIDGPFTETKELIAGYWMWQVRSMEEAVEWVKRIPAPPDAPDDEVSEIEIRPVFELADFAAQMTPAIEEQHARVASELARQRPGDPFPG